MKWLGGFFALLLMAGCTTPQKKQTMQASAYQTSAEGDQLTPVQPVDSETSLEISLDTATKHQEITGFGGAFTEASAYLLQQMSDKKRAEIMNAYFNDTGLAYSLTRTHMNSCDFSLDHYSYAPIAGDTGLKHFSIEEDRDDIIPMIKEAQSISEEGFKVIASPWTAPPWMKDNQDWEGGKLLPEYYDTWARFFVKYQRAYEQEGIPIWAFTVENEPLGNDASWESMHYTPEEMATFVKENLGPTLANAGLDSKILVYDQNRGEELEEWASVLLNDSALLPYIYGTAVHWYTSTVDWFPKSLQYTHELAPSKKIIHTEGCIDADKPRWRNDAWYWQRGATDWGYQWAREENKKDHPKYVPAFRYARDIIGCLNNHVTGWVDWNMVLNAEGGPNHAENWCNAPVIVKPQSDEVYYTPLFYVMGHFSKFVRPGARVIGLNGGNSDLMTTALQNPDGSIALIVFNPSEEAKDYSVKLGDESQSYRLSGKALQTVVLN